MSVWEAVVLGLVQGAGEFLPVSSSGHLLLLEKLGVGEEDLFFNICLHLGTLLSVIIVMPKNTAALSSSSSSPASPPSPSPYSSNISRPPSSTVLISPWVLPRLHSSSSSRKSSLPLKTVLYLSKQAY